MFSLKNILTSKDKFYEQRINLTINMSSLQGKVVLLVNTTVIAYGMPFAYEISDRSINRYRRSNSNISGRIWGKPDSLLAV